MSLIIVFFDWYIYELQKKKKNSKINFPLGKFKSYSNLLEEYIQFLKGLKL